MAKKKFGINLLPQEEFEASMTGRVLRWAMTTFRYIVIVTEMIVMGAFLSRFWLDAQNSDLNDLLEIKTAQIAVQEDFEKEFRKTQTRLSVFQALSKEKALSNTFEQVSTSIPESVRLQSLNYTDQDNVVQVKGVSGSEIGIAQFMANLKSKKVFKKVELNQIASSEDNQGFTIFGIKLTY